MIYGVNFDFFSSFYRELVGWGGAIFSSCSALTVVGISCLCLFGVLAWRLFASMVILGLAGRYV